MSDSQASSSQIERLLQRLGWLRKRVSVMSKAELKHRLKEWLDTARMHRVYRKRQQSSEPPGQPGAEFPATELLLSGQPPGFDSERLRANAASIITGEIRYGGHTVVASDDADFWHEDPASGAAWPQQFFARINRRHGELPGDIRVAWEASRLQHLVAMAALLEEYGKADAAAIAMRIEQQVLSWRLSNPLYQGIHYISAMECALRIISLHHIALFLQRAGLLQERLGRVISMLTAEHAQFVRHRLSLHSSAGNHTLAEAAGLIYAALSLPGNETVSAYYGFALDLFEQELDRQVRIDGSGLEQSSWYHRFNIELGELLVQRLLAYDKQVPRNIELAVKRGGQFLATLEDVLILFPLMGDCDDGYALSAYYQPQWRDLADQKNLHVYKDGGYTLRRQLPWSMLFSYGPLGMAPSYGHGHADALSLLLRFRDQKIFIDTGTGSYAGDPKIRRYYRGTRAHNCLQIGDKDQAQQETPFMWSRPYTSRLQHQLHSRDLSEIWANVTLKDDQESRVWRYVGLRRQWIVIVDRALTREPTDLTLRWHTPQTLTDSEVPGWWHMDTPAGNLNLYFEGADVRVVNNDEQSLQGTHAPRYGEIEPVSTIELTKKNVSSGFFITILTHQEIANISEAELGKVRHRASEYFLPVPVASNIS